MKPIINRKKRFRLLIATFRNTGSGRIFLTYIIYFFLTSLAVLLFEPGITRYTDSLWLCFAAATTIGFGDITAVTIAGRILIILLSVISIAVVSIFTAVITSFFMSLSKLRASESAENFTYELMHLSELSKDELEALSKRVKDFLDN